MVVLGIDTAGRTASLALLREDTLLYEVFSNTGLTHSETLLPLLDGALQACGLGIADIDVFGVCAGPGSFTGLRIGLSLIKGLALPAQTPCAAVSSLEALARCYPGEGTVIPALDARRGQIYRAAFSLGSCQRLLPDEAVPVETLEDFVVCCKKPAFFVGDGAALCYNRFGNVPGIMPCSPALGVARGVGVALCAAEQFKAGQCVSPAALLPDYHRLSQAERERAEREAGQQAPPPTP